MNYQIFFYVLVLLIGSTSVYAEESNDSSQVRQPREILPGEEVTTSSGKKVDVWTTKGPVPVSKAPEPFEDESEKSLQGVPIIVDADGKRRRHHRRTQ